MVRCVFETAVRVISLILALVIHHFTRNFCLQFSGLGMRKLREINFLLKSFADRFDWVALVKHCSLLTLSKVFSWSVALLDLSSCVHICWSQNTTNIFIRYKKSNNEWLCTLMLSGCLYSSSFVEHFNCILLCDWVPRRYSVSLRTCTGHNSFVLHLALARVWLCFLPYEFRAMPWMWCCT